MIAWYGYDWPTTISSVAACLNNIGPGFSRRSYGELCLYGPVSKGISGLLYGRRTSGTLRPTDLFDPGFLETLIMCFNGSCADLAKSDQATLLSW